MSTFAWYSLQIAVAMTVFVTIGETVGVKDFGLAPAIVSMAAAYGVTFVVSEIIDWRRRRSLRRFAGSDEFQRYTQRRLRPLGHTRDVRRPSRRPEPSRIARRPSNPDWGC